MFVLVVLENFSSFFIFIFWISCCFGELNTVFNTAHQMHCNPPC